MNQDKENSEVHIIDPKESFTQPEEEIIFYDDKETETKDENDPPLFEDYNMGGTPIKDTRETRGTLKGVDHLRTNYNNVDQDPQEPKTLRSGMTYDVGETANFIQSGLNGLINLQEDPKSLHDVLMYVWGNK